MLKIENFARTWLSTFVYFFGPCRAPLAARSRPLMVGIRPVETVLLFRPSNAFPRRRLEAEQMLTGFSCILMTCWLPARNTHNRFQYPPVSLGFDMC